MFNYLLMVSFNPCNSPGRWANSCLLLLMGDSISWLVIHKAGTEPPGLPIPSWGLIPYRHVASAPRGGFQCTSAPKQDESAVPSASHTRLAEGTEEWQVVPATKQRHRLSFDLKWQLPFDDVHESLCMLKATVQMSQLLLGQKLFLCSASNLGTGFPSAKMCLRTTDCCFNATLTLKNTCDWI